LDRWGSAGIVQQPAGQLCNRLLHKSGASMAGEIITTKQQELGSLGFAGLPTIISAAGERASFRFIEFFTANIVTENGAKNQSFEWASALIPPACLPPGQPDPWLSAALQFAPAPVRHRQRGPGVLSRRAQPPGGACPAVLSSVTVRTLSGSPGNPLR